MKVKIENELIELSMVSSISEPEHYKSTYLKCDEIFARKISSNSTEIPSLAFFSFDMKEIGREKQINVSKRFYPRDFTHLMIERDGKKFYTVTDELIKAVDNFLKEQEDNYQKLLEMWDESLKSDDIPKLF